MRDPLLLGVLAVLLGLPGPARCPAQDTEKQAGEQTEKPKSLLDPIGEVETPLDDLVTPDQVAAKAFGPPPGARQLTETNLWVDPKKKRVYFDGYVAMNDGPLEMFACPRGTKEHESVIGTLPKANEVHAALLAIGAEQGKPVRFRPKFEPASGQVIRVWVCWRDPKTDEFKVLDARKWVRKTGTKESMSSEWVFAGSSVWVDPLDNRKYYRADQGDMICVSNFSTAMLDVNIASSAQADDLVFSPYTERIPDRFTPVRLVMVPLPEKKDDAGSKKAYDAANQPPGKEVLPKRGVSGEG